MLSVFDQSEFLERNRKDRKMSINEYHCRSILTRATGYLREVCSHSLNPYIGCGFGLSACGEGCYVRFNQWLTRGRVWGSFVDIKTNASEVYLETAEAERRWARNKGCVFSIFMSSSTDPWQPVEKKYRVTRAVLDAMISSPPDELILQTHTANIFDDAERIKTLSGFCSLRVHVSIEGDVERLPGLPPPPCSLEQRIGVIGQLAGKGLTVVACLSPLYPMKDPDTFFKRLADAGAAATVIDHFIFGDGSGNGSRTLKTALPEAMARVLPGSVDLAYREAIARTAVKYLPVGISCKGFAGIYSRTL